MMIEVFHGNHVGFRRTDIKSFKKEKYTVGFVLWTFSLLAMQVNNYPNEYI